MHIQEKVPSREQFLLPTLGPKLEALREEVCIGRGFQILRCGKFLLAWHASHPSVSAHSLPHLALSCMQMFLSPKRDHCWASMEQLGACWNLDSEEHSNWRVSHYAGVCLWSATAGCRSETYLTRNFASLGPSELRPPFTGPAVESFFCNVQTLIAYWGFGLYWGNVVSQNAKAHIVGHVKYAPPAGSYSACICLPAPQHTAKFHTDPQDLTATESV